MFILSIQLYTLKYKNRRSMTFYTTPRVFLYASPKSYKLLPLTKYLYGKYMPEATINILGHGPAPEQVLFDHHFMFISVKPYLNSPREWSIDISNFIKNLVNEPYIIFSTVEFLLFDKVNIPILAKCIEYMTMSITEISSIRLSNRVNSYDIPRTFIVYEDSTMLIYSNKLGLSSYRLSLWKTSAFVDSFSRPCTRDEIYQYGIFSAKSFVCFVKTFDKTQVLDIMPSTIDFASYQNKISVFGLKNEDIVYILEKKLVSDEDSLVFACKNVESVIPVLSLELPIYIENLEVFRDNLLSWEKYKNTY